MHSPLFPKFTQIFFITFDSKKYKNIINSSYSCRHAVVFILICMAKVHTSPTVCHVITSHEYVTTGTGSTDSSVLLGTVTRTDDNSNIILY